MFMSYDAISCISQGTISMIIIQFALCRILPDAWTRYFRKMTLTAISKTIDIWRHHLGSKIVNRT